MHQDAVVMSAKEAGMERVVVRHTISSPLPPEAAKLAEKVRAKWQWPGFGDAHAAKNSIVVAGWLHALEGGCNPAGAPVPCWKPDALLRLLNEQVPENESVVVWATGKGEHVRAMDVARSSGRPCYLINGDTPPEDRQTIITEWREDAKAGDGAVLIVSPKLAKWGIDMSQANTQVWWSRSWSYEDNRQAEARTMHPTKKAATIIYDLVTSDESADAAVLEGLAERRENAQWYAERIAGKCPGS
jgi:superfamily II DNA or RNA helicase